MNKIDEAWALLRRLPADKQEMAADAILDFATESKDLLLSDEQVGELERRLEDVDARCMTLDEFRSRVGKLVS